jgi:SAM-dependent methyltransferase
MNSKFDDKEYWSKYYDDLIKKQVQMAPSPFAKYLVEEKIIKKGALLIELGCGSGRDALFFSEKGLNVIAIDQCANTASAIDKFENIHAYAADFTRLDKSDVVLDIVYSRFTMHSINEADENRTLEWVYKNLDVNGIFCVEVRTIKDPLCGLGEDRGGNVWYYNDHHRRFVDAGVFKKKLSLLGFEMVFYEEKNGFAIHGDEDPIVLRAIVRKK